MFRSLLQPRCIESQVSNKFWIPFGNAPLALSECHLVTPSKLQWLQWDDEKVSCMCFCGTSFWKEMKGWKLKNQQKPSAFSRFGRRRDIGFALHTYIYIYTHTYAYIYTYISRYIIFPFVGCVCVGWLSLRLLCQELDINIQYAVAN